MTQVHQSQKPQSAPAAPIYSEVFASPVGELTLAATDTALQGVWFEGQKYFPTNAAEWRKDSRVTPLAQAHEWLECYFAGEKLPALPTLNTAGTAFQQRVWQLLSKIPSGETVTYGQLARQLEAETDRRMSAQAVGGAVGRNRFTILIPCHRVLGADGSLTGYAGGTEKKLALLRHEGVALPEATQATKKV